MEIPLFSSVSCGGINCRVAIRVLLRWAREHLQGLPKDQVKPQAPLQQTELMEAALGDGDHGDVPPLRMVKGARHHACFLFLAVQASPLEEEPPMQVEEWLGMTTLWEAQALGTLATASVPHLPCTWASDGLVTIVRQQMQCLALLPLLRWL